MKFGRVLLILLVVVVGSAILVGGCVYSGYNRAVSLDENVKSAWAQVESQLQRRYELLPNLIETVKGVAGQESNIFLGIAEARKAYFQSKGGSVGERARSAGMYESALSRLLVLRETYPELKSNESFLKLQDELAGTENRLAVERKRFNDTVKQLNSFTRKITGRFYSSLAGVEPAEYFKISDEARTTPKVDFSKPGSGEG